MLYSLLLDSLMMMKKEEEGRRKNTLLYRTQKQANTSPCPGHKLACLHTRTLAQLMP